MQIESSYLSNSIDLCKASGGEGCGGGGGEGHFGLDINCLFRESILAKSSNSLSLRRFSSFSKLTIVSECCFTCSL